MPDAVNCPACAAILDRGNAPEDPKLGGPYRFACGSYYQTRMDLRLDQPLDTCPRGHRHV